MAHYGIVSKKAFGVQMPILRKIASETGRNHTLADKLWATGIHDARMLACLVADPALVTKRQMEQWARDFDNWAICDTCCLSLFDKTPFAFEMAHRWSKRKAEYVKRAGFALMACLAWHDTDSPDSRFRRFFVPVKREATDERNSVHKAVNWALRQIGKRNATLLLEAIAIARQISTIDSPSARWISSDALRELRSPNIRNRLKKKKKS